MFYIYTSLFIYIYYLLVELLIEIVIDNLRFLFTIFKIILSYNIEECIINILFYIGL